MKIESIKIVVGCYYLTTWQRNKSMRFVLAEIKGNKARLQTRRTKKDFWTNVNDLIFINSTHNCRKALEYQSMINAGLLDSKIK